MKRFTYIETYLNGSQLIGSDFTRVLPLGLGKIALNNRMTSHKQHVSNLFKIKPYLTKGDLTFKIN
jgi:hypothetical protein